MLQAASNTVSLNVDGLAAGHYVIEMKGQNVNKQVSFVKQ